MRTTLIIKMTVCMTVISFFHQRGALANSWHLDRSKRQIIAAPDPVYEAGDAVVIVSCVGGVPSFAIRVRDPIPIHPKVRLQFGGHRGRKIHFLGEDGILREFQGFSRGTNPRVAVASAAESRDIVINLLPKVSRVAWFVDMDDGFDSLEVSTDGFSTAWQTLRCEK